MKKTQSAQLKDLTTMKLGGEIGLLAEAESIDDVIEIVKTAKSNHQKLFVIGGGSNLIARDEGFDGVVLKMSIRGFEVLSESETEATIKVGAGEDWDELVSKTVEMGFGSMALLSAIPGTVGAGPIQNIGAYGQEISEILESVDAYDKEAEEVVNLSNADCNFGYRDSIFRSQAKNRYIICRVTLRVDKKPFNQPFYTSLQKYVEDNQIQDFSPASIRKAVMEIRKNKLPDPNILPNAGSFFKNAIVSLEKASSIQEQYPDAPIFDADDEDHKKVPSGWLIEQSGLKGQEMNGIKVHEKNALILINQSASKYEQLAEARDKIIKTVAQKFDITLEQEPMEIF